METKQTATFPEVVDSTSMFVGIILSQIARLEPHQPPRTETMGSLLSLLQPRHYDRKTREAVFETIRNADPFTQSLMVFERLAQRGWGYDLRRTPPQEGGWCSARVYSFLRFPTRRPTVELVDLFGTANHPATALTKAMVRVLQEATKRRWDR